MAEYRAYVGLEAEWQDTLRIPAMPTTDSGKPIADSKPCRSPWRSGGP